MRVVGNIYALIGWEVLNYFLGKNEKFKQKDRHDHDICKNMYQPFLLCLRPHTKRPEECSHYQSRAHGGRCWCYSFHEELIGQTFFCASRTASGYLL
ncbi:MAG: hypothetical protein WA144_11805, partial [Candidatus Methanoperedens sp.]